MGRELHTTIGSSFKVPPPQTSPDSVNQLNPGACAMDCVIRLKLPQERSAAVSEGSAAAREIVRAS